MINFCKATHEHRLFKRLRFCEKHDFEKPNDGRGLRLMNACASSMLEHFPDLVFAYGVSDEYSFVFKEGTKFHQRRERKILSICVSYFTSAYVLKWNEFFPSLELKEQPYFDGRIICYPRVKIVRDYLSWRQVDCHINNQYNTCFWMLRKSGKSGPEAQEVLKGTDSKDKNELLFQQFNLNYNNEPAMFRKGSCVYREQVETAKTDQNGSLRTDGEGNPIKKSRWVVTVAHLDIIKDDFWKAHPYILGEED